MKFVALKYQYQKRRPQVSDSSLHFKLEKEQITPEISGRNKSRNKKQKNNRGNADGNNLI